MGFQLNDWVKLVDGDYTTVTHSTFQELHTVEAVDLDDHWYSLLGFNKVYYNDKDLSEGFYWNLPLHKGATFDSDLSIINFEKDKKGVYLFPYENVTFNYVHEVQQIVRLIKNIEIKIEL